MISLYTGAKGRPVQRCYEIKVPDHGMPTVVQLSSACAAAEASVVRTRRQIDWVVGRAALAGKGFPTSTRGSTGTASAAFGDPTFTAASAGPDPDEQLAELVIEFEAALAWTIRVSGRIAGHLPVAPDSAAEIVRLRPGGVGECAVCERYCSGSDAERLRSAYCPACYRAWLRDGRPDRLGWERGRRAELDAIKSAQGPKGTRLTLLAGRPIA